MSIVDYLPANPIVVPVASTAADAIQAMVRRGMGAATVVDEHGVVAGIFTERDVMTRVALSGRDPHTVPLTEVMTTPVLMATRSTSIAEAISVMINHQKRHLPVVEDDGRIIGILSIRHVLERKVDELTAQIRESANV
ncbi:MAG TPA: CBS domain-containing protein [Candidatus Saccharimonadales bacterium]|nr:CBS domain-containing protein [Candidatus Saccharimonadales bacterium]